MTPVGSKGKMTARRAANMDVVSILGVQGVGKSTGGFAAVLPLHLFLPLAACHAFSFLLSMCSYYLQLHVFYIRHFPLLHFTSPPVMKQFHGTTKGGSGKFQLPSEKAFQVKWWGPQSSAPFPTSHLHVFLTCTRWLVIIIRTILFHRFIISCFPQITNSNAHTIPNAFIAGLSPFTPQPPGLLDS